MNIVIVFNHFQSQDGVCQAAIGMANALAENKEYTITLCPLFTFDESLKVMVDKRVNIKPVFRMYFRGFQKIIEWIPKQLLHRLAIGNGYDIEIGYCMKMPIQIVASAAHIAKNNHMGAQKKFFAWMHGYDEGMTLRREYEDIGRVICVSKYNAEKLRCEADAKFDVEYAYNIIDENSVINKGQEPIEIEVPKKMLFCSVGRLTPEKGYLRLIRVVKRLIDENYSFQLWIIGDGPERENIEKEIIRLNIKNVTLLGKKENPHAYTSKSNVFICSSFSEGYSTACTEAAMLGVPIITTDVPGAKEIIEDACSGFLVDNSENGLYKGIKRILDEPQLLNEWKNKLNTNRSNFFYKTRVRKISQIIER